MILLLATQNTHKVQEIKKIFSKTSVEICSLKDIPEIQFKDVDETGETLEQNAELKCKEYLKQVQCSGVEFDWIASEDSGLFVQALGGRPGVFSARYAGANATDEQNNQKLLEEMNMITRRNAMFKAVVCLMNATGQKNFFFGELPGTIAYQPRGTEGFGYDPVFIPRGYRSTLAELGTELKTQISHRRKAWEKVQEFFCR
jgi:XTP/dITP diphosphohydrolase